MWCFSICFFHFLFDVFCVIWKRFEEYLSKYPTEKCASWWTFLRVFHGQVGRRNWSETLKIRRIGQFAECSICAKLKQWRRIASSPMDLQIVEEQSKLHQTIYKTDRAVDARLAVFSEKSTNSKEVHLCSAASLLSMTTDGLDQVDQKLFVSRLGLL